MSPSHPNPFHPKRRSACDRCHGQKMRCTRAAGQHDCTRCLRLRRVCHYSPATGTAAKRDDRSARVEPSQIAASGTADIGYHPQGDDPRAGGPLGEASDISLTDLVHKNGYDLFFPPELWSVPGPQDVTASSALETAPAGTHVNNVGLVPPESHWSSGESHHLIDSFSMTWNSATSVESDDNLADSAFVNGAASPSILCFLTKLTNYFGLIPFRSPTAHIQTCPSHGGPLTPHPPPFTAPEFAACLDCTAEGFRVDDTFRLAEELISQQPNFLSEIFSGAVPRPCGPQQQPSSPPGEEGPFTCRSPDLSAAFLLVSCHLRMISIWELVTGRLCYVLRKKTSGEVLPSTKKSCAFLQVGSYEPSPRALEVLYRSFLREIAERLQACADDLVKGLRKPETGNQCQVDDETAVQFDAVATAANAVRRRVARYLTAFDQDAP